MPRTASPAKSPGFLSRIARFALLTLKPNQRLAMTREGRSYFVVWLGLMAIGLYLQSNLVLLIAGLAAGPLVASIVLSSSVLRGLELERRVPPYAFAGGPLAVDYVLVNRRKWTAALATVIEDEIEPLERAVPGATVLNPRLVFARVSGRGRERSRWESVAPARGRYQFGRLDLVTRGPFGLLERRHTLEVPDELIVYPRVGELTRNWNQMAQEATRTRRGLKNDRSSQEQEYHGLRDYRAGDSLRWIHWRTSARLGSLKVREFEQQREQDLALLLDPWLPRTKVTAELRESLEQAIRFVATIGMDSCRRTGRRLILGWTGPVPGLVQGYASAKMLHEVLGQLAVLRGSPEGQLAMLFDSLPMSVLRDGQLIIVSTRAVNVIEEAEKSSRLSGGLSRGLFARVTVLDAARGPLTDLIRFDRATLDPAHPASAPALPAVSSSAQNSNGGPYHAV
jgi:uncharacterized protein (DUF58 family)